VTCSSGSRRPTRCFHQEQNGMSLSTQAVTKIRKRLRADFSMREEALSVAESSAAISGRSLAVGANVGRVPCHYSCL